MKYTSSEIAAWKKVSHFFETDSILDIDACSTYLQAYLKRPNYPVAISDEEYSFFVVFIKKAVDLPESGAAFARLYNAPRSDGARIQGNDGARLQSCLSDLSESHPHVLRKWLKAVSLEADITNQILLIRDVKQWLPNDDVGDYINASTLKMKPAAFVKKFTPDVFDMQWLLAVGKELQAQKKCAHLGLLIVQGIFIAMYGKDCIANDFDGIGSNRAQPQLEVKYSARAAFGLMQKNGIAIEPRELIRIVKLRYNAESLESDALAYCYDGLKTNATPDLRVYALAVLDAVLEAQSKNPGPQYNRGLFHIHTMLTNEHLPNNALWLKRIEDALIRHINFHSHPASTFPLAVKYAPNLAELFLNTLQERLDDNDNQQLLQNVCFEGQYRDNMYYGLNTSESYDALQYLTHKRILPEQITRAFAHRFDQIFQENANRTSDHIRFGLEDAMRRFSMSNFPIEQLSHLKTSNVVPKWILTTLCLTADTKAKNNLTAGLPEVNQDPFPFLRMLYPEHTALWKTMLKSILVDEPNDCEGYKKQQHQLFNTLSATFLPRKPTLNNIISISETMGITCVDYVVSACENAHALELPFVES